MGECKRPSFAVGIMGWVRYANALEDERATLKRENKRLSKIERVARLYLEHGEPELADDLDRLLTNK